MPESIYCAGETLSKTYLDVKLFGDNRAEVAVLSGMKPVQILVIPAHNGEALVVTQYTHANYFNGSTMHWLWGLIVGLASLSLVVVVVVAAVVKWWRQTTNL